MFSAEPVCSCAFFATCFARETAGAARIRHSLLPHFSGDNDTQTSGTNVPRECGRTFAVEKWKSKCHNVIASQRVGAKRRPMTGSAKQSTLTEQRKNGLLRFARNDVDRLN